MAEPGVMPYAPLVPLPSPHVTTPPKKPAADTTAQSSPQAVTPEQSAEAIEASLLTSGSVSLQVMAEPGVMPYAPLVPLPSPHVTTPPENPSAETTVQLSPQAVTPE